MSPSARADSRRTSPGVRSFESASTSAGTPSRLPICPSAIAAAIALGQIGSRDGVPALVEALSNERTPGDVRRESARALGLIGDARAVPALRSALTAKDPYLSSIAFEALRRIDPQSATRPG